MVRVLKALAVQEQQNKERVSRNDPMVRVLKDDEKFQNTGDK